MLNKDQYNQDEYNDYYRQETEGAEIKGSSDSEGSSNKGLLLLLGLIALGVAGYFGYKTFNSTTEESKQPVNEELPSKELQAPALPTSVQKAEPIKETVTVEAPIAETTKTESSVVNQIEKAVSKEEKMSPEEIAKIVQIVMSQMKTEENIETTREVASTDNDSDLMKALSDESVTTDSVEEKVESLQSTHETTQEEVVKEVMSITTSNDHSNKISLESTSNSNELSKLSDEINNLMNDEISTGTSTSSNNKSYTSSIKKEVKTRANAMRIIVVRKGDTLGKIALRAYGNSRDYKKIYQANPDILNRPDKIYVGQKLSIPQ